MALNEKRLLEIVNSRFVVGICLNYVLKICITSPSLNGNNSLVSN